MNDISPHVSNIGRMVEDMENKLRQTLDTIYFSKTKASDSVQCAWKFKHSILLTFGAADLQDIANELRNVVSTGELRNRQKLQSQISGAVTRG